MQDAIDRYETDIIGRSSASEVANVEFTRAVVMCPSRAANRAMLEDGGISFEGAISGEGGSSICKQKMVSLSQKSTVNTI